MPALAAAIARNKQVLAVAARLQIMETRTEAPEVVGSLSTLSEFFTDNTPATRRRLRSTIENQGVRINEQFLEAAQSVIKVRWAGGLCQTAAGHEERCRFLHINHRHAAVPCTVCLLQMLDVVQGDLDSLSSCCDSMGASLAGSRSAAANLLHDTDKLQRAVQVGSFHRASGCEQN